jgi:hypothetical protein
MNTQLDEMKQAIAYGKVSDKAQAVEAYNKLAVAQRVQREKVKALADQYNVKVARLNELR